MGQIQDKRPPKKINEFLEWERGLLAPLLQYPVNGNPFILNLPHITVYVGIAQSLQTLCDFGSGGCLCINGRIPPKDPPPPPMCGVLSKLGQVIIPANTQWYDFAHLCLFMRH